MSYSILLYGPDKDGKTVDCPISDPLSTIEEAKARAMRVGRNPLPGLGGNFATGYRVIDEDNKLVVYQGIIDK